MKYLPAAFTIALTASCSSPDDGAGRGSLSGDDDTNLIEDNVSPGIIDDGSSTPDGLVQDDPSVFTPPIVQDEIVAKPACQGNCQDIPATPFIDEGTSVDAGDPSAGFAQASGNGVCVLEPPDQALMPANWSPPLFEWSGSDTAWEITVSSPQQTNDLKGYTSSNTWLFPPDLWFAFAENNDDNDVTVTIRGKSGASATTTFRIAPVRATGSMVYAILSCLDSEDPTCSLLDGFNVGDVSTTEALTPMSVDPGIVARDEGGNLKPDREVRCIGCHTSTPGGNEVAFTDSWPWTNVITSIQEGSAGTRPAYLTDSGSSLIGQPWLGVQTFSEAHWSDGNRIVISSYGGGLMEQPPEDLLPGEQAMNVPYRSQGNDRGSNQPFAELAWMDLEAQQPAELPMSGWDAGQVLAESLGTSWGFLAREGDARGAMTPDWANAGDRVVYVSTDCGKDGRLGCGRDSMPPSGDTEADLFWVPYNSKMGGAATPLAGASDPGVWEYYPAFSADDKLIAFNRVAGYDSVQTEDNQPAAMYYNPASEIWVVPSEGGTATRLNANDPAACDPRGVSSPGVYNSWPKWSPRVVTGENGLSYYWLIFQSARDPNDTFNFQGNFSLKGPNSKLYLAGIVMQGDQIVETSPAMDIWFQRRSYDVGGESRTTNNLTPAWDTFPIPAPPPVPRLK